MNKPFFHRVQICLLWIFMGSHLPSQNLFASAHEYLHVIDIYEPSKNYLQYDNPTSPFQPTRHEPSLSEVVLYRERLAARLLEEELEKESAMILGPEAFPGNVFDPVLTLPSLATPLRNVTAEVTTSPWLNLNGAQANSSSEDPGSTPPMPWIQKTLPNNSTIYIPFSFTPGNQPPVNPSSVIYSQPDAMSR